METGTSVLGVEDIDSHDFESTFSGLGSLPDRGGPSVCSRDFDSFTEGLNLSVGGEEDVDMGVMQEG